MGETGAVAMSVIASILAVLFCRALLLLRDARNSRLMEIRRSENVERQFREAYDREVRRSAANLDELARECEGRRRELQGVVSALRQELEGEREHCRRLQDLIWYSENGPDGLSGPSVPVTERELAVAMVQAYTLPGHSSKVVDVELLRAMAQQAVLCLAEKTARANYPGSRPPEPKPEPAAPAERNLEL